MLKNKHFYVILIILITTSTFCFYFYISECATIDRIRYSIGELQPEINRAKKQLLDQQQLFKEINPNTVEYQALDFIGAITEKHFLFTKQIKIDRKEISLDIMGDYQNFQKFILDLNHCHCFLRVRSLIIFNQSPLLYSFILEVDH